MWANPSQLCTDFLMVGVYKNINGISSTRIFLNTENTYNLPNLKTVIPKSKKFSWNSVTISSEATQEEYFSKCCKNPEIQ